MLGYLELIRLQKLGGVKTVHVDADHEKVEVNIKTVESDLKYSFLSLFRFSALRALNLNFTNPTSSAAA